MPWSPSQIERVNIYLPRIEVKIDRQSEWQKVQYGIKNLDRGIIRAYEEATEKIGNRLVRIIQQAIEHGSPPGGGSWAPLSQSTLRHYKKKWPAATTPYKRSGNFKNAIGLSQSESGYRMYVGVSQYWEYTENYERGEDVRTGMTAIQLAKLLEFGGGRNGKIPARPLFNPALQAVGGQSYISKTILESLRKEAHNLGFKYVRISRGRW